jgi:protein O-GlcNAc transferase
MPTLYEVLQTAVAHHQAGRFELAEGLYRQVLAMAPRHPDALQLFGLLCHQMGRPAAAIDYIRQAITLAPTVAEYHNNLGEAYRLAENLEQAVACFQRAIELKPELVRAQVNLAHALHGLGHVNAAIARYQQALQLAPGFAEAWTSLGNALQGGGRLDEAIACYRRALQADPRDAKAHNDLGIALREQGNLDASVACYQRAIALRPDFAEAYNNLAVVCLALGRREEAFAHFRRAIELQPAFAAALVNLGQAFQEQGDLEQAAACYQQAVRARPSFAKAHNALGVVWARMGRSREALDCYQQAIALQPDFIEAHSNLGGLWQELGDLDQAVACCRRAVELNPQSAPAHNNLANALQGQGNPEASVAHYQRAIALCPTFAEAHCNLGSALQELGRTVEAAAAYREAIAINPRYAQAHNNLGMVCRGLGDLDQAAACYRQAIELNPQLAEAHNNLGTLQRDMGRIDEALDSYRRALALRPDWSITHSNLLFTLQYRSGVTRQELAAAHAEFERRHGAPLRAAWPAHPNLRDPERPLRVGFLSFDLARHPVGFFLIRALESFDRAQCQAVCYSTRREADDITARFQAAAALWRDAYRLSDTQLAEQIRADQIDILFDLAGHTAQNRLLVFARKPAPIQITWAGYVGTTGLSAMDYLLADRYEVPPEAEVDYAERVLRMPHGYVCFDPPGEAPPVGLLPARSAGHVTFGSFNNLAKISLPTVAAWADILRRTPGSRLLLRTSGLEMPSTRQDFAQRFAACGLEPDQVELVGRASRAELLAEYNRVDIALDPFPYNGGLTTCEALWMGVPVVTWPGATFASRHSLSHLMNVGLSETIASTREQYLEVAVGLARNLEHLAALRAQLRAQVAASPLCNGAQFAADFADLLRSVWRDWCRGGSDWGLGIGD